jgi:hypothetical protein
MVLSERSRFTYLLRLFLSAFPMSLVVRTSGGPRLFTFSFMIYDVAAVLAGRLDKYSAKVIKEPV